MPETIKVKVGEAEHEVEKEIYDAIRGNTRRDQARDFSVEIDKKLSDFKIEFNDNASVKDKIGTIGGALQSMQQQIDGLKDPESTKEKTPIELEKQLADEKQKFQEQLKTEQGKMFKSNVYSQIQAKLISKGWKDSYLSIVPNLIEQHYIVDSDNGSVIFRDRADGDSIMHGDIHDRAEEIAKKYSDMIQSPRPGWGNGSTGPVEKLDATKRSARDLIAAGISEIKVEKR